jgi:hypothetical protein
MKAHWSTRTEPEVPGGVGVPALSRPQRVGVAARGTAAGRRAEAILGQPPAGLAELSTAQLNALTQILESAVTPTATGRTLTGGEGEATLNTAAMGSSGVRPVPTRADFNR